MNKIKVTAVSYLNTKPLLYGIFKSDIESQIDLQLDIPSVCAERLLSGEAELGLVPVAIIPFLEDAHIVSDYCIGTNGAVKTVCIYGEVPIEKMDAIYLDFHSRTSVELTSYLLEKHWRLSPKLLHSQEGYIEQIGEKIGGLVIGDRTIGLEAQFPYVYDLGSEWKKHTGLPFVFAAWVSNKKLPESFLRSFNQALKAGIEHIPQLINLMPMSSNNFDLKDYFTNHISYELDAPKRKALHLFLEYLRAKKKNIEHRLIMN